MFDKLFNATPSTKYFGLDKYFDPSRSVYISASLNKVSRSYIFNAKKKKMAARLKLSIFYNRLDKKKNKTKLR